MFTADQLYYLVAMGAAILLPFIPAFILFKELPSDASVSGLFQGLKLKLGGAFAGFFAIFVALQYFFPAPKPPESQEKYQSQVWHLSGRATLEGPDKLLSADISVQPATQVLDGHTFKIDIPVAVNPAGELVFPHLIVNHPPCHQSSVIDLNHTKQVEFGGASTETQITLSRSARGIEVKGIHLPLDLSFVQSDGTTKCKI